MLIKKVLKSPSLLTVVFCFFLIQTYAQSLRLKTLTEEDGLSSNSQWSTNALCQDSFGFIWFATLGGLDRYDGYEIKSYRGILNSERDISNNRITAIAESGVGNLLLGTEEEGLIYYNREQETFTPWREIVVAGDTVTLKQINVIRKRGEQELVIGTAFQGIFALNLADKSFKEIRVDHPSFSPKSTNNLVVLKNGLLAIISFNGVFVEASNHSFDFYEVNKNSYLKHLIELSNGDILVRSHNGSEQFILDLRNKKVRKEKSLNKSSNCSGVMDGEGNLWLSKEKGELYKKNGEILSQYQAKVKRKGIYFPVCMQDMIATEGGSIYYASNSGTGSFKNTVPLIKPYISDDVIIFHSFAGGFYFASGNTVYSFHNGLKKKVLSLPYPFQEDKIYNFHKDNEGNYWVGHKSEIGRATRFDRNGKVIGKTYFSALSPQYIELAEDGLLSIGNQIYRAGEKKQDYKFIGDIYEDLSGEQYPDYRVKYYQQLQSGEIWLATFSDGIKIIDRAKNEVKSLPIDPYGNGSLKSDNPYYIFEHSSGNIFVATEVGIHIWDPSKRQFSYLQERPENKGLRIKGMGEDKQGRLWILSPKTLRSYQLDNGDLREFTLDETVFVDYEEPRDMHFTEKGEMLFQGFNKIYSFKPNELTVQRAPSNVQFIDLFVSRKKVYPSEESEILTSSLLFTNELDLSYHERNLGFSFVSVGGEEQSVSYFYRLIGENDEWIETQKEREVFYSNLSPGDYIFEVKAQGGSGTWTPQVSQLSFSISPPWYQTLWAYLFYVLVSASLIYFVYRIRINQLLKYQNLRIKVSSDLHDDVGSLLTGISMKAQILGLSKKGEEKKSLGELSRLSHTAMDQMRDIVWALDAKKDTIQDLKQRMFTYAQENLSLKNIKYNIDFKSVSKLQPINPEQRQNLYYIFKEAITNILKHSNASSVKITFHKDPIRSQLIIHDNGSMDKDLPASGQGLSNIKMRAERLGGKAIFDQSDGFKITVTF